MDNGDESVNFRDLTGFRIV